MEERLRILLVDDDDDLLKLMKQALEREGYEVEETQSPLQALELLRAKKFDIMITDIVMPEMDGLDLLNHVRKQNPLVQVIIITGYFSMQRAIRALEEGAAEYILKPFDSIGQLLQTVKTCEEKIHRWWECVHKTAYKRNRENKKE